MAKISGTVRKNRLEGGFYELHADDGTVYRLEGGSGIADGDRITVEGEVREPGFGIHMVSHPVIEVRSVTRS